MARAKKIEDRTNQFIRALEILINQGDIKDQLEVARLFGYKGGSAITEIKNGNSNIQPDKWELFKKTYNWPRKEYTEISEEKIDLNSEIVRLKQEVDNLNATRKLHTKLIKKMYKALLSMSTEDVDEEYTRELINILSHYKKDQDT